MLSVEDINEMQKTIDRQNRIITVLKRTVKQWVKEYNILDEIIDMYKMSENEATEIIAELEAENERLKQQFAEFIKSISQPVLLPDVPIEVTNKYKQTLQEIKKICKMDCGDCEFNQDCDCNYQECEESKLDDILNLITKAEEE